MSSSVTGLRGAETRTSPLGGATAAALRRAGVSEARAATGGGGFGTGTGAAGAGALADGAFAVGAFAVGAFAVAVRARLGGAAFTGAVSADLMGAGFGAREVFFEATSNILESDRAGDSDAG